MTDVVVLGNGFDLASGLESSYKDFMNKRVSDDIKEYLETFYSLTQRSTSSSGGSYDYIRVLRFSDSKKPGHYKKLDFPENENVKTLNFWDVYLYFKYHFTKSDDEILWYDIESDINSFITGKKSDSFLNLKENISIRFWNENLNNHTIRIPLVCSVLILHLRGQDYSSRTTLDFLLDELKAFEINFKKYIQGEANSTSYDFNATKLINKIIQIGENEKPEIYMLNFNYTSPFGIQNNNIRVRNIHGKTTNEIIFGIDTKGIIPDDEQYKFTKTYRLLIKNNKDNSDEYPLPNPENVKSITFFGHSLSKADYSYFQSIFDYYNLYSSEVGLVFACQPYGIYSPDDMQRSQAGLLTKLLHNYSLTLENQAHGENLIHKLLVEKRLSIRVI